MSVERKRRRFTVDEYHAMARSGILTRDDRVELLQGEILRMAAIGSRHAACVRRLNRLFSDLLGDEAIVSIQNPVRLSDFSEPEPDVALLVPREDFYAERHPEPGDIFLLVEVADASRVFDRTIKLPLYARAGVPEVWVVDLEEAAVELYREPGGGSEEGYAEARRSQRGETLIPRALREVEIPVSDVL